MIIEPMQADEIIRNGRADMVFLARELGHAGPIPVQYARAHA